MHSNTQQGLGSIVEQALGPAVVIVLSVSNSSTIVHKRKLVLELTQHFRTTCQKGGALIMMREQSIEQIIVLLYISVS